VIMTIGPTFQTFKTDSTDSKNRTRFITQTPENGLDPNTLFARQNYFGGKFSLIVDTRDNAGMPRRGIYWQANVRHLSGLNDASYEVTQLNSDFTFHINLVKNVIVIANRFGGGHNFGDFEFHQAQYLGSEDNLRGYRRFRFAGRSKAFNNFDLRIAISKFRTYLFTGSWGVLGFVDAGKVWADNDTSDDVLVGYGGGIWIAPLRRFVFQVTYMMSDEDKFPIVGLGWRF
jgi:outer membrane protein assembly factor BamA